MKKNIVLLLSFLCIFSAASFAQENIKVKKRKFHTTTDSGFKEAWKSLKKGNYHFSDKRRGSYFLAIPFYEKAFSYNSNNAELNYKLGASYLRTFQAKKALTLLKKSYDADSVISPDILFLFARAYHFSMKFDSAMTNYAKYKNSLKRKEKFRKSRIIDHYIEECKNGIELVKNPARVFITNLGDSVNSSFPDYSPVFYQKDSLLYFTSRRGEINNRRNRTDNMFFEDIYVSKKENGKWKKATLMSEFNTKGNDASAGMSALGNEFYVFRGKKNKGDIYVSEFENGKWKSPSRFGKVSKNKSMETATVMSVDSAMLFLVSDRKGLNFGGKDIYIAKRKQNGKWQTPYNIGSVINTEYDEEGVYISRDCRTLYFSSKGHNSMGGFDIFKSVLDTSTDTWSKPENVGYPVNTPYDDVFISLSYNQREGYYSTNNDSSSCGDRDIYQVTFLGLEKQILKSPEDLIASVKYRSVNEPLVETKEIPIKVDIGLLHKEDAFLIGKVLDASTNAPLQATVEVADVATNKVLDNVVSSAENGGFSTYIPTVKSASMNVKKDGYMFYSENFTLPDTMKGKNVEREVLLQPVMVGSKIVLKNVFFDTGKSSLRKESFPELERIIEILRLYPKMTLEISGHTDNVGDKGSNKVLSQNRAQAVVDYLVKKGVPKANLVAKGYADDQPISTNTTKEGRQQNRRVEAKILKME